MDRRTVRRTARKLKMFIARSLGLLLLTAAAHLSTLSLAAAQDKQATPPDSYRVVMENERVRMIEVHVKPRSKVNVDSPPGRDRFLYMLSDGALILSPPGKRPYEFALQAGETAVFPAVSPTVENDTDSPVRALMVEVKDRTRSAASSAGSGRSKVSRGKSRGKVAARSKARGEARRSSSRAAKTSTSKPSALFPLNLRGSTSSKPAKKPSGRS